MLELLTSAPRIFLGTFAGLLLGGAGAYAAHVYMPGSWPALGVAAVVVGLVVGVLLGAKWEAHRS